MKGLLTRLIRFYRKKISPLKKAPSCRFYPTCSRYALDALKEWGVFTGTGMAAWRVLRCNPFGRGGFDPVPLNPKRRRPADECGVTTEEGNLS